MSESILSSITQLCLGKSASSEGGENCTFVEMPNEGRHKNISLLGAKSGTLTLYTPTTTGNSWGSWELTDMV